MTLEEFSVTVALSLSLFRSLALMLSLDDNIESTPALPVENKCTFAASLNGNCNADAIIYGKIITCARACSIAAINPPYYLRVFTFVVAANISELRYASSAYFALVVCVYLLFALFATSIGYFALSISSTSRVSHALRLPVPLFHIFT